MVDRSTVFAFLGLLAFGAVVLSPQSASAGGRARAQGDDLGEVHAVSRHGNGEVSGPVRPSRFGYEVRLPGGTWVECRRSCSETLRVEALDMWENQGTLKGVGSFALECGVFGCLDITYPR